MMQLNVTRGNICGCTNNKCEDVARMRTMLVDGCCIIKKTFNLLSIADSSATVVHSSAKRLAP
jgi:hypothetical protein